MTDKHPYATEVEGLGNDELLRLILESAKDFAVIAMDNQGNVTSWNLGAERLLGFSSEDMIGHTADVIFTSEDYSAGAPARERSTASNFGRAEDERWHRRKDGSVFWGSGIAMPLSNQNGFVKIFRDLTARREAEERLRQSEELFRLLATNIPQLVFRTKGNGERIWGSPQWVLFTGLTLEDSLGYGWVDAIHPDDRSATMSAWTKALETGEYYMEHRIQGCRGSEFRWHQTRANPIDDPRGDGDWVGTSTDIHDMRGLQERQKVLVAELQHRTRNLLAVVQSIARQTINVSSSLREFGAQFEGRLRALGRVQTILERVEFGAVDLRELVDAELKAHRNGRPDKITISGPPAMLPATSAQALALGIHELATNSVKYGAIKQPSGKLEITWQIESGGSRVVFDWRETGVEMPDLRGRSVKKGYGSELIERALPYQLRAETRLDFGPDGVHCQIATTVSNGEAAGG